MCKSASWSPTVRHVAELTQPDAVLAENHGRGTQIKDVTKDLGDGVVLIKLLEFLSGALGARRSRAPDPDPLARRRKPGQVQQPLVGTRVLAA